MLDFDVIVAADEQGGIGRNGELPWHLPGDLRRFRELTTAEPPCAVLMGRVTWESLPSRARPLPGRLNVVLTRQPARPLPGDVRRAAGLEVALHELEQLRADGAVGAAFVIGGAEVFRCALRLPACRRIFLTRVLGRFDCDVFLPPLPASFSRVDASATMVEGDVSYRFERFERSSTNGR